MELQVDGQAVRVDNRSDEEALSLVASLIQPLPQDVTPSDEFLRRMRLRLLALKAGRRPATTRAA